MAQLQERPRRPRLLAGAARVLPEVVVPAPDDGRLLRRVRGVVGPRPLDVPPQRRRGDLAARLAGRDARSREADGDGRLRAAGRTVTSRTAWSSKREEEGPPKKDDDEQKIYARRSCSSATPASGSTARRRGWSSRTGPSSTATLPGAASWVRYRIRYKSKLAYAVVDPDRKNVWDWNHLNDSKVLAHRQGRGEDLGQRAMRQVHRLDGVPRGRLDAAAVGAGMTRPRRTVAAGFAALSHSKLILLLALTTAVLGPVGAAAAAARVFQEVLAARSPATTSSATHPTFAPPDFLDFIEAAVARRRRRDARPSAWRRRPRGPPPDASSPAAWSRCSAAGPFGFGQFFEPARRNLWHNVKCFARLRPLAAVVARRLARRRRRGAQEAPRRDGRPTPPARRLTLGLARRRPSCSSPPSRCSTTLPGRRAATPRRSARWRGYRFARLRPLGILAARARSLVLLARRSGAARCSALVAVAWLMPAVSCRRSPSASLVCSSASSGLRSAVRVAAWGSYIGFLETARPQRHVRPSHASAHVRPRARALGSSSYFAQAANAARPRGCARSSVAKEKRTQASSPNASPGTAATCASARSRSQNAADPFTPLRGVERRHVGERVERALGHRADARRDRREALDHHAAGARA